MCGRKRIFFKKRIKESKQKRTKKEEQNRTEQKQKNKRTKTKMASSKDDDDKDDTRVPVTILTGYLGSGKTTLLNRILKENPPGKKLAVIENEFGEIGIDGALVPQKYQTDEEILEMNNGCVCCTVRGDLIKILNKLLRRGKKLDGIIIETTGLADPAPVCSTFFMDAAIRERARLDAIITVLDAKHIVMHLDDKERAEGVENESAEQIAFADRILLNKTDLVKEEELPGIEDRIRALNRGCKIIRCTHANVPLSDLIDIRAFDLDEVVKMDPEFLSEDAEHQHDDSIKSVGASIVGEMDMTKLNAWLSRLLQEQGQNIFRMKGILSVRHQEQKFVFQAVHMVFQGEPAPIKWAPNEVRESKIIFIGRRLDKEEILRNFRLCLSQD